MCGDLGNNGDDSVLMIALLTNEVCCLGSEPPRPHTKQKHFKLHADVRTEVKGSPVLSGFCPAHRRRCSGGLMSKQHLCPV